MASLPFSSRTSGPSGYLRPEDVREFQRLLNEHCGVSLTDTGAWNRATELVALYRMFIGPIPEDPDTARSSIRLHN
jgi:hypothetical protein